MKDCNLRWDTRGSEEGDEVEEEGDEDFWNASTREGYSLATMSGRPSLTAFVRSWTIWVGETVGRRKKNDRGEEEVKGRISTAAIGVGRGRGRGASIVVVGLA